MEDRIFETIEEKVELKNVNAGDYAKMKVGPMIFNISAYDIEGIGRLSIMKGKAMLGLMKMDTIMMTPSKKDGPVFSYDRILAMGNDTLIIEMYDTCLESRKYPELAAIKDKYASLPDRDPGTHWYDFVKCSESISKKGKKITADADMLALEYIGAYIDMLKNAKDVDETEKQAKNAVYVDGLLNNGGPSTDQFVKQIGKEKTTELFKNLLFGTK